MTAPANHAGDEFLDVVRLWRLAPGTYVGEVIDAATECLIAGLDTEALRELAGASPRESLFVLEPLILDTVERLGLSDALEPDLQLSALLALARRVAAGALQFGAGVSARVRLAPRQRAGGPNSSRSDSGVGMRRGMSCCSIAQTRTWSTSS